MNFTKYHLPLICVGATLSALMAVVLIKYGLHAYSVIGATLGTVSTVLGVVLQLIQMFRSEPVRAATEPTRSAPGVNLHKLGVPEPGRATRRAWIGGTALLTAVGTLLIWFAPGAESKTPEPVALPTLAPNATVTGTPAATTGPTSIVMSSPATPPASSPSPSITVPAPQPTTPLPDPTPDPIPTPTPTNRDSAARDCIEKNVLVKTGQGVDASHCAAGSSSSGITYNGTGFIVSDTIPTRYALTADQSSYSTCNGPFTYSGHKPAEQPITGAACLKFKDDSILYLNVTEAQSGHALITLQYMRKP